uniref:Putative ovule protein n=1 Tax=Solanum chacoense TaxID=4108 RepID=A0A0V0HUR3_SOLCH
MRIKPSEPMEKCIDQEQDSYILPFGVAQWFGLGTSMLEVSSSKSLASESKGFAFWVELVAPGLPSAGYLSYVVCELLHRRRGFYPVRQPERVAAGPVSLSIKKKKELQNFLAG